MTPACDPVPALARAARRLSIPARHVHQTVLAAFANFFTTSRAARTWACGHPEITGTILSRPGALCVGIDQFGTLLQPADGDASGDGA